MRNQESPPEPVRKRGYPSLTAPFRKLDLHGDALLSRRYTLFSQ